MERRYLDIYLNDQLAAGIMWREVARRAQRSNSGTSAGETVARVATAIAEDVATFETIMGRVGARRSKVKPALAIVGERVGRLKLNGNLVSSSPLSRFVELDFLAMGIEGKKILWENLRDLAGLQTWLPDIDFDELIDRAQRQRDDLEPFRRSAGTVALAGLPEPQIAGQLREPAASS